MRWIHDAVQDKATVHHNTTGWSDVVCTDAERADVFALATARHIAGTLFKHHRGHVAPLLRMDADAEAIADVRAGLVEEDPPVPHIFPDLFEEEEDKAEMPEHEVPEPEDAHEEAPIPVLNRFLALHIVCTPSVG